MCSLFFLCVFLLVASAASDDFKIFRKCCPENQSLLKLSGYDTISTVAYECIDSDYEISDYTVTNPSSHLIVNPSVFVDVLVPKECDLELILLKDLNFQLSTSREVCYDRLVKEINNGTVESFIPKTVALVCNSTELKPEIKLEIQNVRKCCPRGQVYDAEYHLCRNDGVNEKWILENLKIDSADITEFENGLSCKQDEYAVELKEEFFNFKVVSRALSVRKNNEGSENIVQKGDWCVDQEYTNRRLVARVCTQDCAAFGAYCMRKCCPVGEHYEPFVCGRPRSRCVPTTDDSILFNISKYMDPIRSQYGYGDIMGIRSGIQCPDGKIALNSSRIEDQHSLTKDGWLLSRAMLPLSKDYCLENFDVRSCNSDASITAVLCFQKAPEIKNFKLSIVLISISAACLALTLVVYCSIPELRNLHGLTLICHVSTMLLAYSCLARVQYNIVKNKNLCVALGYGIYFGFVAAFAWLNVMCLDIWWTFGSVRTVQAHHKSSAGRRRFFWYSLYAWGVAITITLIMFLLDKFPLTPVLDADMGTGMCWFGSTQNSENDWPHYIFFVIPMGLVSGVNFVLWALTARHCARVKSEVHRLQAGSVGDRAKRRFRIDKANLTLTGKLWVVMGAGWISELISTLLTRPDAEPHWFVMVMDMVNELQGVLIFIILVFKPKLYYLIRKRLGLEKPDARQNGASTSGRTSSTFLSRTISSDERTNKRVSMPTDNAKLQ